MKYICFVLQSKTHIKVLLLIFCYCIVLFHGVLPHSHSSCSNGAHHSHTQHPFKAHHDQTCNDNSSNCAMSELIDDDGLHEAYLKSSSTTPYSVSNFVALIPAPEFGAFHKSDQNQVFSEPDEFGRVRHGILAARLLRGPPTC